MACDSLFSKMSFSNFNFHIIVLNGISLEKRLRQICMKMKVSCMGLKEVRGVGKGKGLL